MASSERLREHARPDLLRELARQFLAGAYTVPAYVWRARCMGRTLQP